MVADRHRARTLAELAQMKRALFRDDEAALSIRSYRPQTGDVIISSYPKCGTTLLQQIFHTLRTGGDMDFAEISTVVPWIETAHSLAIDLDAPQKAAPRGFKSHLSYQGLPQGLRYVVSLRDPKDALVSAYRFNEGWFFDADDISIDDFFRGWLQSALRGQGYYEHLLSWWEQCDNPNVLLLTYEDMLADPADTVRRVAAFCGITLDDALLALTVDRCSFAYMFRNRDKFDESAIRTLSEQRCNLPLGGDSAKVRQGNVGGHRDELPRTTDAAMDALWARLVTPKLGFARYRSLRAELADRP